MKRKPKEGSQQPRGATNAPQLRRPEGTFAPGVSGNPGGQSKEKRAFLERLKEDDPDTIYEAFMQGVRDGVPPIVIRAVEYLAGKPKENVELSGKLSAAIEHDIKAEVIQSPERMRTILAVLKRAGQLTENTETAEPVETKETT